MRPEDQLNLRFVQLHPVQASRQLEILESPIAAEVLIPFPTRDIANVLGCCQPGLAARILEYLSIEQVTEVVSTLPASTAFVVFRQFSQEFQGQVVDQLGPIHGPRFRLALIQPKQSAGSLANPRVVTLPPDVTAEEGIELIKRNPRQASYYLYVVDRDAQLEGVVTMKQLLMGTPKDFIGSVMNDQVITIPASATHEELIKHPHWQQFHMLPVVDHDRVFLGVLRYQILQQVIEKTERQKPPGSLPAALIELWEAYSLAGIRILTELSEANKPDSLSQR
ncbi:MAG: CBS domain-containing protein [Nitrospirales bacterium]|nr:CBS domain-containing protein [Nitrospirales bacterium]